MQNYQGFRVFSLSRQYNPPVYGAYPIPVKFNVESLAAGCLWSDKVGNSMLSFCTVGWSLGHSVREKRQVWRSVDVWRATHETKQEGQ